jgi:hypothetical protein
MKAFVLRLNPDTRPNIPYSKYPTKAEYEAIHKSSPMDGFHEAVNFLSDNGVVRGYLPPRHSLAMQSPEPFALATITAKTAKSGGDLIVGLQVGCIHHGENKRVGVPPQSRSLNLLWHFSCPAALSFVLPEPIPNARKLILKSTGNWVRGPTHEITQAGFSSLLRLALKHSGGRTDRKRLKNLADAFESGLGPETDEDFETAVAIAMDSSLDKVKGNAHPATILVTTVQYVRDPKIVALALKTANGICGDCRQPGPFISKRSGLPYLEVHHKRTLKRGGADTPGNVIALCPNCHRKRHHGAPP